MPFVVTGNCTGCRFTDCVTVCPADCFHADGEMVYIDPEECVDCGACVAQCPVDAIYAVHELPEELKQWEQINADRAPKLPVVREEQYPLPGAIDLKKQRGH
jgi:ferredoxin